MASHLNGKQLKPARKRSSTHARTDIIRALQRHHGMDFSPVVNLAFLAVKMEKIADQIEITDANSAIQAVSAYRNSAITYNDCAQYITPKQSAIKVEHSVDTVSIASALELAMAKADQFIGNSSGGDTAQAEVVAVDGVTITNDPD